MVFECDRCNKNELSSEQITEVGYKSNSFKQDLCDDCRKDFLKFLEGYKIINEKVNKNE